MARPGLMYGMRDRTRIFRHIVRFENLRQANISNYCWSIRVILGKSIDLTFCHNNKQIATIHVHTSSYIINKYRGPIYFSTYVLENGLLERMDVHAEPQPLVLKSAGIDQILELFYKIEGLE